MTATSFIVLASTPAAAAQAQVQESRESLQVQLGAYEPLKSNAASPSEKIDQELLDLMRSASGKLMVHVFVTDVDDANDYFADRGLPQMTRKGLGIPVSVQLMELDSKQINLMAESPAVLKMTAVKEITYDEAPEIDEIPKDTDISIFEDLEVDDVHGAVDAWEMGWTGEEVNIAVLDTGFDMAHPDLQGQQARYASGPYAGWPIAYDDLAARYWSDDVIGGWVADTSTQVAIYGDYIYFDGQRYMAGGLTDVMGNPIESQSGMYRIGYHPDIHLYALWGGYAAVLVVDAVTPYVYDTVYVDVTRDFDFTNDKACVMGDEISYFDSYNSTSGVDDYSMWNAGDGFADFSGGMVYWISDGSNVLPASDWIWGASYVPDSGEAVAFMGEFTYLESHGTMTASAALATNTSFDGMLAGMAPGAKLICVPLTYDYYSSWLFALAGADAIAGSDDDAQIVSNSYGFSSTAVNAGFDDYDMFNLFYSAVLEDFDGIEQLWFWSTGNGGPGYGTVHSVYDYTSVHVGAGTTQQYRALMGYEEPGNQKWGDVAPFSNSGPGRNGKLNAEIIASGMYSVNPAPLNQPWYGGLGDGYVHFQLGSGTSHATPTAAGGAALGYDAYWDVYPGWIPEKEYVKAELMASADDMHFDPLKQGAGWLNVSRFCGLMSEQDGVTSLAYPAGMGGEPGYIKAALYPGTVYDVSYEFYPNFLYPGQYDDNHSFWTWNLGPDPVDVTVSSELLIRTGSDLISVTTVDEGSVYEDITDLVPATTDLLKVTMYMDMAEFDPNMDYFTDVGYMLEMHDWVDLDSNGVMGTDALDWELFRYAVDGSDCNYNQIMLKDPIDRTTDGLIARIRDVNGAAGVTVNLQLDYYELEMFPWIELREEGDTTWLSTLEITDLPGSMSAVAWEVNVSVPADAPVGTYAAAIYVDDGSRVQCIPVVINVAAEDYEFEFGGESYFDTPYNNDFTGIADKQWRFEVGDWRIYWSVPRSTTIPASDMVVFVNWTELPTDVNAHILYPDHETYWGIYGTGYVPWGGPGVYMYPAASSDEMYMGAGKFGVKTSTGGPQEVLFAWDLGDIEDDMILTYGHPQPFAVVTRCPVMSGSAASDTISGYTKWSDILGTGITPSYAEFTIEQPGTIPLEDTIMDFGAFGTNLATELEVTAGGMGPYQYESYPSEAVYQDTVSGSFEESLADAWYTEYVIIESASSFSVDIGEMSDAPDLDLGVWLDENGNGEADLSEPYWYSAGPTAEESLTVVDPEDGTYIIKVLGYSVTASPGYFWMETMAELSDGYVMMDGVPDTLPAGIAFYGFNVSYSLPERAGTYLCSPSFGFYGTTDTVSMDILFEVIDVGAPVIEDVLPADGEALDTNAPMFSFTANDRIEFYSGIDPYSVAIIIDDMFYFGVWDMTVMGDTYSLLMPLLLGEGAHTATFYAADNYGNEADPVTVSFTVNTVIETFTAAFTETGTSTVIPDGMTVATQLVAMMGMTDPYADVWISSPYEDYMVTADASGDFEQDPVGLVEGVNVFTVTTMNDAGITATLYLTIMLDTECTLTVNPVESPTVSSSVTLSGLTEPGAVVTVDGDAATVGPGGAWTYDAALSEGVNAMDIMATDSVGNEATGSVTVVRDTTPPSLAVTSPADGVVVTEPSVMVVGTTEAGAMVYVNGVLASDGATSWSATVVLAEGDNTITVMAEDALGNDVTETLTVTYEPPVYVTPDELDQVQQDTNDAIDELNNSMSDDLDDVQQDLQGQVDDADSYATTMMYLVIILFLVSVVLTLAVWNSLRGKAGGGRGGTPKGLTEQPEEPPAPSDVEREFEELEKEIDRGGR